MLNVDKEKARENKGKEEKGARIQDIIVTCPFQGEYRDSSPDKKSPSDSAKMSKDQDERLGEYVVKLMSTASEAHKKNQQDENCITRLSTNEFSLYTEKPLDFEEFKALQEKIAHFASKCPENVHLVLSSFAVKTEDEKHLMNVVSYVECGKDPKMHLIVKNHCSVGDPLYSIMAKQENGQAKKRELYNVMKEDPQDQFYQLNKHNMIREDKLPKQITISGKEVDCSFNNVLRCKTKGGAEFLSCVDICLDHQKGVAKQNLEKLIDAVDMKNETIPTKCSHLVTSSTIEKHDENKVGQITHVDPKKSQGNDCKEGCSKEELELNAEAANEAANKLMAHTPEKPRFGVGEITVRITPPMPVQDLVPQFLNKVNDHNREVKSVHPKQKQLKSLENMKMPAQKIPETEDKAALLAKLQSLTMPGKRDYVLAEKELSMNGADNASHSHVATTVGNLNLPRAQTQTMTSQFSNHKKQNGSRPDSSGVANNNNAPTSENPLNNSRRAPGK